jgi:predicted RNA-binding Zn ribbon-like protein
VAGMSAEPRPSWRANRGSDGGRQSANRTRPRGTAWTFHIGYGALCLDFANTVSWRGGKAPADHLSSYGELIRFAVQADVLTAPEGRRLRREAARRPDMARRALRRAAEIREALYRAFARVVARRVPRAGDLQVLNEALPAALARLKVAPYGHGLRWAWHGDPDALDQPLWPIVRDAAVFLTSCDLSRLRACRNPRCRWIFLDTTKSRTRRWCSMAVCGNRDKLRRFRERQAARPAMARR